MPHHTHQLSPLDHDELARVVGGLYEESYGETGEVADKSDIPPKTLRVAFYSCTSYNPYNFYYVQP